MEAISQKSGHVEANGTSFYYEIAGSGDPLVLIHASIADRRMWDGQFHALAGHYMVVRYDMRGHGNTAAGDGEYSGVQDMLALLGAIGIETAILVGCSGGGTNALDFALEHPAMVKALVLVSATPSGYEFKGEPPRKLLEFFSAYQQQNVESASELATQVWLDGPRRTPDQVNPDVRRRVRDMMRELVASGAMGLAGGALPERPAAGRLPEVQVPTIVIVGDQDDPSIREAGKEMVSAIPGAEMVVIAGAGHLLNIEKPEEFNRALLDFLGQ